MWDKYPIVRPTRGHCSDDVQLQDGRDALWICIVSYMRK